MSSQLGEIFRNHKARTEALYEDHQRRVDSTVEEARRDMKRTFWRVFAIMTFSFCAATVFVTVIGGIFPQ